MINQSTHKAHLSEYYDMNKIFRAPTEHEFEHEVNDRGDQLVNDSDQEEEEDEDVELGADGDLCDEISSEPSKVLQTQAQTSQVFAIPESPQTQPKKLVASSADTVTEDVSLPILSVNNSGIAQAMMAGSRY